MTRIYINHALVSGEEIALPDAAAHHVNTVLRLALDAEITLFNGHDAAHCARLIRVSRNGVRALIGEALTTNAESPLDITLVQSISRGERMEFTLQKAVELGVKRISPVISQRTVVRLDSKREAKRLAHWRGIVQHAAEQCGRTVVPELAPVRTLAEWRASGAHGATYVLHPGSAAALARQPKPNAPVTLIAGPEGGFDEREIASLALAGACAVALGPRILRTETAALCALSVMQTLWGDLA